MEVDKLKCFNEGNTNICVCEFVTQEKKAICYKNYENLYKI